jgi:hypothetical protein
VAVQTSTDRLTTVFSSQKCSVASLAHIAFIDSDQPGIEIIGRRGLALTYPAEGGPGGCDGNHHLGPTPPLPPATGQDKVIYEDLHLVCVPSFWPVLASAAATTHAAVLAPSHKYRLKAHLVASYTYPTRSFMPSTEGPPLCFYSRTLLAFAWYTSSPIYA